MGEFLMPSLGADMDTGAVAEWRVQPGDVVQRGDIVAVVQTDKADVDVEVFEDGRIEELLVPEGRKVPVGTPLARLGPLTTAAAATRATTAAEAAEAGVGPRPRPAGPGVVGSTPDHLPVRPPPRVWSPLVRHLAEHRGLDLAQVTGTGPGGAIRRRDVERAVVPSVRSPVPVHPAYESHRASPRARRLVARLGVDLDSLTGTGPGGTVTGDDVLAAVDRPVDRLGSQKRAVGELMARAKREIPHYYLSTEVELDEVLDRLQEVNADRPPARRILPAALLLRATARAAVAVAGFNGRWLPGPGFVPDDHVHLGIAVAQRTGGLVAPTLPEAHRKDLDELMDSLRGLVTRARSGHLTRADLDEATLTVTNLGERGAGTVYGVIVPPQVAIVGFGRIERRPWVVTTGSGGTVVEARRVVTVTLSGDHRVTNGHEGSRFLGILATHLRTWEPTT